MRLRNEINASEISAMYPTWTVDDPFRQTLRTVWTAKPRLLNKFLIDWMSWNDKERLRLKKTVKFEFGFLFSPFRAQNSLLHHSLHAAEIGVDGSRLRWIFGYLVNSDRKSILNGCQLLSWLERYRWIVCKRDSRLILK